MSNPVKVEEVNDKLFIYLYVERGPVWALLFMGFFALMGALIPFIVFIVTKIQDIEIGPGFILTPIISFGVSFYLTRIILWNTVGTEKYEISSKSVIQVSDYKWFKDSKRIVRGDGEIIRLKHNPTHSDSQVQKTGRIVFESNKGNIESVIDLPVEIITGLIKIIEARLNGTGFSQPMLPPLLQS
ncbi:MAG: hypothetical protein ACOCXS_02345 [Bacteroidota bacterium]